MRGSVEEEKKFIKPSANTSTLIPKKLMKFLNLDSKFNHDSHIDPFNQSIQSRHRKN